MPYCPKCGVQVAETALFCQTCGTPLRPTQPTTPPTPTPPIYPQQPPTAVKLEIIQALASGFEVLRKNPIIFVPALIGAALSALSQVFTFYTLSTIIYSERFAEYIATGRAEVIISTIVSMLSTAVPALILSGLVSLFLNGMIIRMAYDAGVKRVSLSEAAKLVASKYITLLIAGIVFGVVVMLGCVALFIPGIFLMIKLLFYQHAILVDNEGILSSLERSWKITKGNWWRIAALALVLGIASIVSSRIVLTLLPQSLSFVQSFIIILFIMPWYFSFLTLAYLQLRILSVGG